MRFGTSSTSRQEPGNEETDQLGDPRCPSLYPRRPSAEKVLSQLLLLCSCTAGSFRNTGFWFRGEKKRKTSDCDVPRPLLSQGTVFDIENISWQQTRCRSIYGDSKQFSECLWQIPLQRQGSVLNFWQFDFIANSNISPSMSFQQHTRRLKLIFDQIRYHNYENGSKKSI